MFEVFFFFCFTILIFFQLPTCEEYKFPLSEVRLRRSPQTLVISPLYTPLRYASNLFGWKTALMIICNPVGVKQGLLPLTRVNTAVKNALLHNIKINVGLEGVRLHVPRVSPSLVKTWKWCELTGFVNYCYILWDNYINDVEYKLL